MSRNHLIIQDGIIIIIKIITTMFLNRKDVEEEKKTPAGDEMTNIF